MKNKLLLLFTITIALVILQSAIISASTLCKGSDGYYHECNYVKHDNIIDLSHKTPVYTTTYYKPSKYTPSYGLAQPKTYKKPTYVKQPTFNHKYQNTYQPRTHQTSGYGYYDINPRPTKNKHHSTHNTHHKTKYDHYAFIPTTKLYSNTKTYKNTNTKTYKTTNKKTYNHIYLSGNKKTYYTKSKTTTHKKTYYKSYTQKKSYTYKHSYLNNNNNYKPYKPRYHYS